MVPMALVVLMMPLMSGCGTVSYLLQAGKGQFELFNRARPIPVVLQDPRVSTRIKRLLAEIPEIKSFGELNGLKPTKNYQDYVQLDRSAAVYVVSASQSLQFVSKEWKFPIVGSFPYLGWFNLSMAKDYAHELKEQGFDVDLRGARAFSTLGWFRDSVLSTMIPEGDEARGDLVNVVIHESVHATVYISGQAYFNESLANYVAGVMTPIYLAQKSGKEAPELQAYLKSEKDSEENEKLMHEAYVTLDELYKSSKATDDKLSEKKKLLTALQEKMKWKREINNATLIQFKTYNEGTPEFETVYKACGEDMRRFMDVMKTVKSESFSRSQQNVLGPVLLPLTQSCKK
jgi:predicted aminopeptidase